MKNGKGENFSILPLLFFRFVLLEIFSKNTIHRSNSIFRKIKMKGKQLHKGEIYEI